MKTIISAYWPTVYKYRWTFIAMLSMVLFTVLIKAAFPFILRELLDGLTEKSEARVASSLMMLFIFYAVTHVVWIIFDIVTTFFESNALRDIDQRSFEAVQSKSMRFFENSFAGSLVTSARRFRNSFENIVDVFVYQLGRSISLIVITIGVFMWERPMWAMIFLVWSVIYCAVSIWFAKMRMDWSVIVAEKDSLVGAGFSDSFSNQATVKSFGKEDEEQMRFESIINDCYHHRKKAWLFGVMLMRIQSIIASFFEIFIILLLVRGWRNGTVSMGDFVFFQTYVLLLMYQIFDIGNATHRIFRSFADAKEMSEIYSEEPEIKDSINAQPLHVDSGEIEFKDVNFKYICGDEDTQNNIHGFNLLIHAGETVAMVGHSGAGKSTLVKLLMRYFNLDSGCIRIDKQDIASVSQISLRRKIAIVPQDPSLFHRNLRDNISFARPDASVEEIIEAAIRSHAWDFIKKLPDGLDTLVGERGVKLSGGERQRVALARAFLADAPILVLDEATSSLDSETEYHIQSAISDLLRNRTCIVIAHRLSTIQRANRIIVMKNGSITEEGSHHQLLREKGIYAGLWGRQSGGYIK